MSLVNGECLNDDIFPQNSQVMSFQATFSRRRVPFGRITMELKIRFLSPEDLANLKN